MNRKQALLDILNRPELDGVYIKSVSGFVDWLEEHGFFTAPASVKHHGAVEGGLFDHSLTVMDSLVTMTNRNQLQWNRPASPYIVGMFHDLCKMDDYVVEVDDPGMEMMGGEIVGRTYAFDYNPEVILTGHGDKSVLMLAPWIGLTEEEIMCIRWHMGAFDDKANWNRYGAAVERWPTVLWTHTADMVAARVLGV